MNPIHERAPSSADAPSLLRPRPATGLGTVALGVAAQRERLFADDAEKLSATGGVLPAVHFAPKAKRVIYLFMSGGPSHIDLFDYKPNITARNCPRRCAWASASPA